MSHEVEYAALRLADGTQLPRTAAQRTLAKFKAALARHGGRAPLDARGRPMVWNEARGFFPRDEPTRRSAARGRTRVVDAARQLTQVLAPDVRRARLERDLLDQRRQDQARADAVAQRAEQAGIELYARASDRALEFLAMYQAGRVRIPGRMSADEVIGAQLAAHFPSYVPLAADAARRARQG